MTHILIAEASQHRVAPAPLQLRRTCHPPAGKDWFAALRLYGALEPWFDKSWRPGEIELVK